MAHEAIGDVKITRRLSFDRTHVLDRTALRVHQSTLRRPRRILASLTFTPKEPQFGPVRSLLGRDFIAGRDLQKYPLIVDGLVHRGNSGGPVVEMDVDFPVTRHYVVGVSI